MLEQAMEDKWIKLNGTFSRIYSLVNPKWGYVTCPGYEEKIFLTGSGKISIKS